MPVGIMMEYLVDAAADKEKSKHESTRHDLSEKEQADTLPEAYRGEPADIGEDRVP